jgi:chromosomal replication initiation ATPase DnaA
LSDIGEAGRRSPSWPAPAAWSCRPEAFNYFFSRARTRDMRSLTALLIAIDRYSLEHKRPITLPLLREVLQSSLNL